MFHVASSAKGLQKAGLYVIRWQMLMWLHLSTVSRSEQPQVAGWFIFGRGKREVSELEIIIKFVVFELYTNSWLIVYHHGHMKWLIRLRL